MAEAKLSWPPSSFFTFPPSPHPNALPPTTELSFKAPFAISPRLYEAVLAPQVPLTFAVVYMTAVSLVNRSNRHRENKPWAVSKTYPFYIFVILHNALLAIYSGVTCGMLVRALHVSVVSPFQKGGIASTLDSLCKIQGPRGLGDAVTYDPPSRSWVSANSLVQLTANGLPDPSDVGRIWNEGLAFWGWVFYLSKFYEVVDTMIILAKGKRSSTLQTYHHAGAMLCMWAGIRYMSPPIWMFVLVNAGIHTMMYTYYTLSTVSIKVPGGLKQLLTTLQILQFIVGVAYAGTHLFVSYSVPVMVPVKLGTAITSAASDVVTASVVAKSAQTIASSGIALTGALPYLRKAALFAVGAQDLELRDPSFGAQQAGQQIPVVPKPLEKIQYRKQNQMIHCLDTNGQAFAIWLNVLYLFPLTALFVRFFVKSYILGQPAKPSKQTRQNRRISTSALHAARRTSETIEIFGQSVEQSIDTLGHEIQEGGGDIKLQDSPIENDDRKRALVNGTIYEESEKHELNGNADEVGVPEDAVEDGEEDKPLPHESTSKEPPVHQANGRVSQRDEDESMSEEVEDEDALAHAASRKAALEDELDGGKGVNSEVDGEEGGSMEDVSEKPVTNGIEAHDTDELEAEGLGIGDEGAASKDQQNGKVASSDLLHRQNS